MTPTHAKKRAKRYRYYLSASLLVRDHSRAQKGMRIPAGDIEALVLVLRLSKNLPHDWKEQRCFLGFAA